MTKDMTRGKPMKLIIQFMIPLLLGNLFQQMYNLIEDLLELMHWHLLVQVLP